MKLKKKDWGGLKEKIISLAISKKKTKMHDSLYRGQKIARARTSTAIIVIWRVVQLFICNVDERLSVNHTCTIWTFPYLQVYVIYGILT